MSIYIVSMAVIIMAGEHIYLQSMLIKENHNTAMYIYKDTVKGRSRLANFLRFLPSRQRQRHTQILAKTSIHQQRHYDILSLTQYHLTADINHDHSSTNKFTNNHNFDYDNFRVEEISDPLWVHNSLLTHGSLF